MKTILREVNAATSEVSDSNQNTRSGREEWRDLGMTVSKQSFLQDGSEESSKNSTTNDKKNKIEEESKNNEQYTPFFQPNEESSKIFLPMADNSLSNLISSNKKQGGFNEPNLSLTVKDLVNYKFGRLKLDPKIDLDKPLKELLKKPPIKSLSLEDILKLVTKDDNLYRLAARLGGQWTSLQMYLGILGLEISHILDNKNKNIPIPGSIDMKKPLGSFKRKIELRDYTLNQLLEKIRDNDTSSNFSTRLGFSSSSVDYNLSLIKLSFDKLYQYKFKSMPLASRFDLNKTLAELIDSLKGKDAPFLEEELKEEKDNLTNNRVKPNVPPRIFVLGFLNTLGSFFNPNLKNAQENALGNNEHTITPNQEKNCMEIEEACERSLSTREIEKEKSPTKHTSIEITRDGNCMYYAYAVSLMHYLRSQKKSAITTSIFNKLNLNPEQQDCLNKLLRKETFAKEDIKKIETTLGPSCRELAANRVHSEFIQNQKDSSLFAAAAFQFRQVLAEYIKEEELTIEKNNNFSDAEIFRVPAMKAGMKSFVKQKTTIIEFLKDHTTFKEDPHFSEYSVLLEEALKKSNEVYLKFKRAIIDHFIERMVWSFFTSNDHFFLNIYTDSLRQSGNWGSEEMLLALHRAIRGGSLRTESEVAVDVALAIYHNNQIVSGYKGSKEDLILNNLNNNHWNALIPIEQHKKRIVFNIIGEFTTLLLLGKRESPVDISREEEIRKQQFVGTNKDSVIGMPVMRK